MKFAYENLLVWRKASELALAVYKEAKKFPNEETYGITSQLRRAALSVPTNIAEGYARRNDKLLKVFLFQAYGFLVEANYLTEFSYNMGYLTKTRFESLTSLVDEVAKLLWGFMNKIGNKTRA